MQNVKQNAEQTDINVQTLNELKSLSGRMAVVEQKVNKVEGTTGKAGQASKTLLTQSSQSEEDEDEADDAITPSLEGLKRSTDSQTKVEQRLVELQAIQSKGEFRSQMVGPKDN